MMMKMVVRRKRQKCYCSRAVYSLWSVLDSDDDDEDGGTEEETEVLLFYSCLFLVVCA